jgi:hypothetical protein
VAVSSAGVIDCLLVAYILSLLWRGALLNVSWVFFPSNLTPPPPPRPRMPMPLLVIF